MAGFSAVLLVLRYDESVRAVKRYGQVLGRTLTGNDGRGRSVCSVHYGGLCDEQTDGQTNMCHAINPVRRTYLRKYTTATQVTVSISGACMTMNQNQMWS